MERHAIVLVALGVAASVLVCGCAYENPATGTQARYRADTLRSEVDAPLSLVYSAALKAADSLNLTVGRAAETAFGAEVRAVDALSDVVTIRLKKLPQERTQLTIAFGVFGDRRKSIMVFNSIMSHLAEVQPAIVIPSIQWEEVELPS